MLQEDEISIRIQERRNKIKKSLNENIKNMDKE